MTTPDLSRAVWRTSKRSQQNGACVEVASISGGVAIRDSKDSQGPALLFPRSTWQALNHRIKQDQHDT